MPLSAISSKLKFKRLKQFPLVFICIFLITVIRFVQKYFPGATLEQILFSVNTSFEGAGEQLTKLFIKRCIQIPLIYTFIVCYLPEFLQILGKLFPQKFYNFLVAVYHKVLRLKYTTLSSILSILALLYFVFANIEYKTIKNFLVTNDYTDFYEKNFVAPTAENISLPQKRNLLILHVESLEKTFANKDFFGESLISDLENIAQNNVQFNHYQDGFATDFTQGSEIAIFTGMPSKFSSLINRFGNKMFLFKDYYSLGNILKDHGYQTLSVQGTKGAFAGQEEFLRQHGIDNVIDYSIIQNQYPQFKPDGEWGYDDETVFYILKEELQNLNQTQPFFIYVLTVDTHFNNLPSHIKYHHFKNPYYNVIYSTNLIISDFIKWFSQQPNFADTTIVIVGDHLRMGKDFAMPNNRGIYNLFINTPQPPQLNRIFSQIDLFPTIIEAMGGKIKNSRLGLGVSLFSTEKTLAEKYDKDYLSEELSKRNALYEKIFFN